jgi:hypothetical protein
VSVKQALAVITFVCGATLAGLAAIHFVWLHPAVIGPFALPIGMRPLVLLFEYSFEIPGSFFFLGAFLAIATWFRVRGNPPPVLVAVVILLAGGFLVFVSVFRGDRACRSPVRYDASAGGSVSGCESAVPQGPRRERSANARARQDGVVPLQLDRGAGTVHRDEQTVTI